MASLSPRQRLFAGAIRRSRVRPRCEPLEDRTAPALFNVQNPLPFTGLNNNGCVVTGDLNKDGFMDAVLTNMGSDFGGSAGKSIHLLYGRGDGTFTFRQLDTGGTNVSFAAIADINGDTWPDVVVTNENNQNDGTVTVFQNSGGTPQTSVLTRFGTPFSTFGNNPSWVGLADVTGDGLLDCVVSNFGKEAVEDVVGNRVTIFPGKGDFTFDPNPATTLFPEIQFVPLALAVADFNGDGSVDIAAVSPGIPPDFGQPYPNGSLYVFQGTGAGGFGNPTIYDTGGVLPVNIQAADLNADGKPDLVMANAGDPNSSPEWSGDSVGVLLNASTLASVTFGITNSLTANTHGAFAVAVADFDLDGKQDIAAVNYGAQVLPPPAAFVSFYRGSGNGAFAPGTTGDPGTYDTKTGVGGGQYLGVGDFDSNGTPDVIVAHASNVVGLLTNTTVAGPQVTINQAAGQPDPTKAASVKFDVVFSKGVTGFDASDVDLSGSSVGGLSASVTPIDASKYTVTVTGMTGAGNVKAVIPAGAATAITGGAGSLASTSTDNAINFDQVAPTVTLNQAGGQSDPALTGPIQFAVVFSEPVTGFTAADVDLSGSSLTGLTAAVSGSGANYTVTVSGMSGNGTVVARVGSGAATDPAGNPSDASTSTDNSVTFGAAAVGVTINQAAGQADPTNKSPITFAVKFAESVTGFDASDVVLGGTVGGTPVAAASGSGQDYTVTVTGMSGSGTVTASVKAGAAVNGSGTPSAASTSIDNSVTFDAVAPAVTIDRAPGQADPTSGSSIQFAVKFSEPVTGFTASDVSLAGSTAGPSLTAAVTGSGDTYTVTVTGMSAPGDVVAAIPSGVAADTAGNQSSASTSTDNSVAFVDTGKLGFKQTVYAANEDGTTVRIFVSRTGSSIGTVSVDYAATDGTAHSGGPATTGQADYTPVTGTLNWADGEGGDKFFDIPVLPDDLNEGTERITLALSNLQGGPALGTASATAAIAPSDGKLILGSAKVPTAVFFDAGGLAGDRVTVRLGGLVGQATVYLTDTDGDRNGPIELIELAGTDAIRSALNVTVVKPRGGTGDGRTSLAEVSGSGLRALNALTTDMNGPGIHLAGYLGVLRIGNVSGGADITMGSPPSMIRRPAARIVAGVIGDGTDITVPVRLANLNALSVGDGTITAPSIGALVARGRAATLRLPAVVGNFNSDVMVSGVGVIPPALAVGRLRAAGSIGSEVINVTGSVGVISVGSLGVGNLIGTDITVAGNLNALRVAGRVDQAAVDVRGNVLAVAVGSFWNSRLDAGYTGADDGTGTYDLPSLIGSFRVSALSDGFKASNVIATTINSVTLASVTANNGGTLFGVRADRALKALVVTSPVQRFVFNPQAASPQWIEELGNFRAEDRSGPLL